MKEKNKKEKCRQRWQDNSKQTPQSMRPPEASHQAPSAPERRYQSTPPGRDATMTTLLPRVSPGTQRGEEEGHRTPSRKDWRHPQAPPRQSRKRRLGFLPTPSITPDALEHSTIPPTTQRPIAKPFTLSHPGTQRKGLHSEEEEPGLGAATPPTCGGPTSTITDGNRLDATTGPHQARKPGRAPRGP